MVRFAQNQELRFYLHKVVVELQSKVGDLHVATQKYQSSAGHRRPRPAKWSLELR